MSAVGKSNAAGSHQVLENDIVAQCRQGERGPVKTATAIQGIDSTTTNQVIITVIAHQDVIKDTSNQIIGGRTPFDFKAFDLPEKEILIRSTEISKIVTRRGPDLVRVRDA